MKIQNNIYDKYLHNVLYFCIIFVYDFYLGNS